MAGSGTNVQGLTVTVTFIPDTPTSLGLSFYFDGLKGSEELGRPFLYELDLSSGTPKGDLSKLLGGKVTIQIMHGSDGHRYFNGVVTSAQLCGMSGGTYRYKLELRPWIWLLSQARDCKIFQQQAPFDIITGIFRDAGFTDFEDKRQNQAGSTVLDYCVQYRETTLAFVSRLMEQNGIYYFFTYDAQTHTLNIADDPNSHTMLPGDPIPIRADATDVRQVDDHVWDFSCASQVLTGTFTMRDYNFETPSADLTAKSLDPDDPLENKWEAYDYPGLYGITNDGTTLAAVWMQSLSCQRAICHATSNSRALFAGGKVSLNGHKDTALDRDYLITRAEYSMDLAEGLADTDATQSVTSQGQGKNIDTFRVKFTAIPGTTHFRLPLTTPRPTIAGLHTAKVVGESGEEITVDNYARVKVKFFWDRSDIQDQNASCWIRVSQVSAGAGFGGLYTPRIGQEVVIAFLEGNPDRPLIVGTVYNANITVPYTLPDKKTTSTIKTNSSQGGGGFNELRFDDTKGSEEVFFQAQYNHTVNVLNDQNVTVKNDQVLTVQQGKRDVTVSQGNDSLTISQGNHSVAVSAGSSTLEAAQSIELKVGANSIKIDTSGVTINGIQLQMTASATAQLTASAPMTLQAPMININ